jgi:hypothetical protein
MRISLEKIGISLLLILLLLVSIPILTYAETSLSITAAKTELEPQEKVTVTVQTVDENQNVVDQNSTLSVKVSRGGIVESNILKKGLTLKNGAATFVFIAPSKPGVSEILLIDLTTNLSAKLSLKILENAATSVSWNPEYAQITKVKGKVAIKYNGKGTWDSALADAQLHEKDTIMTWDKSWLTLRLFDGSILTVEPGTTVYIKSLKSSDKVKQSVFKVFTGKVLAKVTEYLEKGSRFEIESESATAGVKGTYFEFGVLQDGLSELFVYDGSVLIEQMQQELSFLLEKGQSILMDQGGQIPETAIHTITPEAKDQEIEAAEEQAETGTEDTGDTSDTGKDTPGPTPTPDQPEITKFKTGLDFGSEQYDGNAYLTVHLQPEFKKIFGSDWGIGLDLVLYQDPITGEMTFSSPDGKVGNIFNWLEYDSDSLYFYYGALVNISYDFGLLFNGYHKDRVYSPQNPDYNKDRARGIQFGMKKLLDDKMNFKLLVPFDVKTFSPWEWVETSTLYALRTGYKIDLLVLPGELGLTLVDDTNPNLANPVYVEDPLNPTAMANVPTGGASLDYSLQLTSAFQPYMELAALKDFGAGSELGFRGKLGFLQYQTGLRYMIEKFLPNYFGDDYEIYKENTLLNNPTGRKLPDLNSIPASNGYYAKLGFDLGTFMNLQIGYEAYGNLPEQSPVFAVNILAKTPNLGVMSALAIGVGYKQIKFDPNNTAVDPWFNANTLCYWYMKYPLNPGLYITETNTFIPSNDPEIKWSRQLSLSLSF